MNLPRLRVAVTYNLRTEDEEEQAERLDAGYVEEVCDALASRGHEVEALEVTGTSTEVFRRLDNANPDIIFNLAEGAEGVWREAFYPMLYDFLGIPYTGAGPGTLAMGLDKRLTEEALATRGVRVPRGRLVTPEEPEVPKDLEYPLLVKPNFEGSSIGIHQDSVVEDPQEAKAQVERLLKEFPDGLNLEEYISGRELSIGFISQMPETLTEVVEYRFPQNKRNIMDYETKKADGAENVVETLCPAPLSQDELQRVHETAARAVAAIKAPDLARVDLRLREDGEVFLIEVNALPGVRRDISPLIVGAMSCGYSYGEVLEMVLSSAALRHGLVKPAELEAAR